MTNLEKKKTSLSYEKEKEIIELIKKVIVSYYPIIDNRLDILMSNPTPTLDICFNFFEENGKQITQIYFLKGTETVRQGTLEEFIINGYVSPNLIINLIFFLLKDHDIIRSLNHTQDNISVTFQVNLTEQNMKGISCGLISLNLEYHFCKDKEQEINKMLKNIFSTFFFELKNTPLYQRELEKYCDIIRTSLTKEEMIILLNMLEKENLNQLLHYLPNDLFLTLYNNYKNDKPEDTPQTRKRIP